jgi:hypothetical protein
LELAIKQAIEEHCPDLVDLQVEGVTNHPHLEKKLQQNSTGWKIIKHAGQLRNGEMMTEDVAGKSVLICKANDHLMHTGICVPHAKWNYIPASSKETYLAVNLDTVTTFSRLANVSMI